MASTLLVLVSGAFAASDDAHALLAKAHAAYVEDRARSRYWNWTTTTTRAIIDKDGNVLQQIPSVTVESPIRSDGKRCNALLAWGDGLQPYLANAAADQRCKVEEELVDVFQMETLLQARQVRIARRSRETIVVSVRADSSMARSDDPFQRCIGSLEGHIELDPATWFPKHVVLKAAGRGCEQQVPVVNHYDAVPVRAASSTLSKGSILEHEYELQKYKTGNTAKNYWALVRSHSVRPLPPSATTLIVWGRRIPIEVPTRDCRAVIDGLTTVSELSAESVLRIETEAKKDK